MDYDTASTKELDRLFNARISRPLPGESWAVSDLISFSDNQEVKLTFIDLFSHRICLTKDRCTNQMCSGIELFEKTCLCRGGQPPGELNLRTLIDECFLVERVTENIEEIGNLQRMLSEDFATSWMGRFPSPDGAGGDFCHFRLEMVKPKAPGPLD